MIPFVAYTAAETPSAFQWDNPKNCPFTWLAGWEINVPFQCKIGYIRDKVLGGDLVPPNQEWPMIQ